MTVVLLLGGLVGDALAWGPATHVDIAREVLGHLGLLPAGLAALLSRRALDYIYGAVAADVVVAKRLSRVKQFCHHWSTGFSILHRAGDDRSKAFAYGYLSHLAADTVAHGKYVPRQIMLTGSTLNLGHLYWEMRAEGLASEESVRQVRTFGNHDFDIHHQAMSAVLARTFLPYSMNRQFFERVNAISSAPSWQAGLEWMERWSQFPLSPLLLRAYREECVDRTLNVLMEQDRSPVLREDPNGTAALNYSRINRRQWRLLGLRGHHLHLRMHELTAEWAPQPCKSAFGSPVAHSAANA